MHKITFWGQVHIIKVFLEIEEYQKMASHQKQAKAVFAADDYVSEPQADKSSPPLEPKKIKFTQSELTSNTSGKYTRLYENGIKKVKIVTIETTNSKTRVFISPNYKSSPLIKNSARRQ